VELEFILLIGGWKRGGSGGRREGRREGGREVMSDLGVLVARNGPCYCTTTTTTTNTTITTTTTHRESSRLIGQYRINIGQALLCLKVFDKDLLLG